MTKPYLPGNVVGRLTLVRSYMSTDGKGRRIWRATCACGARTSVRQDYLRKCEADGVVAGCGCRQREYAASGHARRTHGMTGTPTWNSWKSMMRRCHDPGYKSYAEYGGVGITVCKPWHDFETFLRDMGERPDDCTLDRERNHLGYFKDNCRWATKKVQVRNRRNTLLMAINGVTKPVAQWAEELAVPYERLRGRLKRRTGKGLNI